jgi:hypothetical protein
MTLFSLPLHCLRVSSLEGPKRLSSTVSSKILGTPAGPAQAAAVLLEEQAGGKLLALQVSVYGVVAPLLKVIG